MHAPVLTPENRASVSTATSRPQRRNFNAEVSWARVAFEGRDVPLEDLRASLECLGRVLAEELPAAAGEDPARYVAAGLETLTQELKEGTEAVARPADVGLASEVDEVVAEGIERFGRIDVLCNIAGRSSFGNGSRLSMLMVSTMCSLILKRSSAVQVPRRVQRL